MSDQQQGIKSPEYKKLNEMQKKYNRQNSLNSQSNRQDKSPVQQQRILEHELIISQSPQTSKSFQKIGSANQSPIMQSNENKFIDKRNQSKQSQLLNLSRSNNNDDSLDQILLSDKKRSLSKQSIGQRNLNMEARLTVSNQKIQKLEKELQEKTKIFNQLQSKIKKQNTEQSKYIKEKDVKLQRVQDTIFRLRGENEKLQSQLAQQLKHQMMFHQQAQKAEETDKELCDLRKNNNTMSEEVAYLRYQNQEQSNQLMEIQNRYSILQQSSADFMKRTKEIVSKNEELQSLLKNIFNE